MRYWITVEPVSADSAEPVYTILSDKAILAQYYDYWCSRMEAVHKGHLINEEECISDWAIVHWAEEATLDTLKKIIKHG